MVGKYEVIDLKEYLELANLSVMLSAFNENYTVSNNVQFTNLFYQKIARELRDFSYHFLSNSLKPLIEGEFIANIIDNLQDLQQQKSVENFEAYISEIIEHLEDIRQLKYYSEWKKLYTLSKIMDKRGYQLNAITLLFEAVGYYCLESLSEIESVGIRKDKFLAYIEEEKKPLHLYSIYTLTNQSRNIVKLQNRFKIDDRPLFLTEEIKQTIIAYLSSVHNLNKFKSFIEELEGLRNNLAHGNSSRSIKDAKATYKKNKKKFEAFCIMEDIFSSSKSSVGRLQDKFK